MRQAACLVWLVAFAGVTVPCLQSDVSGSWTIALDTHVGESTWRATFSQDGPTVSGEIDIGDREVLPLKGTVEDGMLDFVFVLPDLDGDQPINLTGSIGADGRSIDGDEGNFSWFGAGRWTAVKEVP